MSRRACDWLGIARHDPAPAPQIAPAGPRLYHDASLPRFQALKSELESHWIELLRSRIGLRRERLPLLWDCDFMFGAPTAGGAERFVLCEINVSSVSPFPPSAIEPLVAAVLERLAPIRVNGKAATP